LEVQGFGAKGFRSVIKNATILPQHYTGSQPRRRLENITAVKASKLTSVMLHFGLSNNVGLLIETNANSVTYNSSNFITK